MRVAYPPCQRVSLTRRATNNDVYLLVANESFKADVLSELLIIETVNEFVRPLDVEPYHLLHCVLVMPSLFKTVGQCLTWKRFPFYTRKRIESPFLHKSVHQTATAGKQVDSVEFLCVHHFRYFRSSTPTAFAIRQGTALPTCLSCWPLVPRNTKSSGKDCRRALSLTVGHRFHL